MSKWCRQTHTLRIMKDFQEFFKEPPVGIFIAPENDNICLVHALIIGPGETPYENGFFYFVLRFPADYPLRPPEVELKTTHRWTVRFNPNLYADGKVCLSILGTWTGPAWSPVQTIVSTLVSIQSLMDAHPYHNEPGYEKVNPRNRTDVVESDVNHYNDLVTHETLRVAVIEMLQEKSYDASGMPTSLKNIMKSHFKTNYQFYENLVRSNQKLDGQPIIDPFRSRNRPPTFSYKEMLEKIIKLKKFCSENDGTVNYFDITKKVLLSWHCYDIGAPQSSEDSEESIDVDMNDSAEVDGSILYESASDDEEDCNEKCDN